MDSNGQDMIVVIQSDDYDQSQGLIVVDPSQLQHMVTSGQGGGHITGKDKAPHCVDLRSE